VHQNVESRRKENGADENMAIELRDAGGGFAWGINYLVSGRAKNGFLMSEQAGWNCRGGVAKGGVG
jgi:hypothetical protein